MKLSEIPFDNTGKYPSQSYELPDGKLEHNTNSTVKQTNMKLIHVLDDGIDNVGFCSYLLFYLGNVIDVGNERFLVPEIMFNVDIVPGKDKFTSI